MWKRKDTSDGGKTSKKNVTSDSVTEPLFD